MQVVWQYAAGPGLRERLAGLHESDGLSVSVCPDGAPARFEASMRQAEVVWHLLHPVTAEVIGCAPRLRLIQKIGVGVNTIDLEAARTRGIAVCNMPGTNTAAVAEMALLLMLAVLRRVTQLDRAVRAGEGWKLPDALQDAYGELGGRTVGLVGYGAVPQRLAPMLAGIGATVLYTSRREHPGAVGDPVALETLLATSDIVSLHLPLTAETKRVIDRAAIATMKRGAILINTARGGLVEEAALIEALVTWRLGGAGLDVLEEEPTPSANRLLSLDNVVTTPHLAWLTRETVERSLVVAIENCRRLRDGEPLLHRVV